MVNDIQIKYADLYTYLSYAMGYENILNKMLIQDCIKRFGSVESFLRKVGKGKIINKLKEEMMIE